jgi:hypothetical protein
MIIKAYIKNIPSLRDNWLSYLAFIFIAGLFFTPLLLQAAAGIFFIIFLFLIFRKIRPTFSLPHYLILCYLLSAIITFLTSAQSWYELPKFLPHFILLSYLPLSMLMKRKEVKIDCWYHWIIFCAGLAALAGAVNFALGKDRTTTTFGGYFTLAALMSWSIPLTSGGFLENKFKKFYWYIPLLLLQLFALWWTFTRSAFLGLFAGFAVWFMQVLLRKQKLTKSALIRWIVIFSLPLILLLLIFFSSDKRINPISPELQSQPSTLDLTSGRKGIILDALEILKSDINNQNIDRLLFGHGLSSYRRLVTSIFSSWESDYLEILMNQGLIGLFILLLLYFYFLKAIWKGLQSENIRLNSLAITGIVFVVMSFFTLKLCSWHSGGIFLITLLMLESNHLEH